MRPHACRHLSAHTCAHYPHFNNEKTTKKQQQKKKRNN